MPHGPGTYGSKRGRPSGESLGRSATTPESRRVSAGKPLAGTKIGRVVRKARVALKRGLPQALGMREDRIKNIMDLVKNKLEEDFSKSKARKAIADAKRKEENEKNRQELERDSEFGHVPKRRR